MTELAQNSGSTPSDFVLNWLAHWQSTQTINTFPVEPRTLMMRDIIRNWPRDGADLDLEKSPFVLVAIVNRIDLGENDPFGPGANDTAGEARFVFAATGFSNNGTSDTADDIPCTALPVLVIFEYTVPISGCGDVKRWAQQWQDLESRFQQSAAYRDALEAITLQFTEAGPTPSQQPNQSSLAQIRTNIFMLEGELTPWELREFRLPSSSTAVTGPLSETTVKQTPDITLNQTQTLADYALANADDIIAGEYVVPETFSSQPFLAGSALLPGDGGGALAKPQFFWDGPSPAPSSSLAVRSNLRHRLSLNTCNGCHGDETNAVFTHVSEKGELSGFLTGTIVRDPAGEKLGPFFGVFFPTFRVFNDIDRRKQHMAQILSDPCWSFAFRGKSKFVH